MWRSIRRQLLPDGFCGERTLAGLRDGETGGFTGLFVGSATAAASLESVEAERGFRGLATLGDGVSSFDSEPDRRLDAGLGASTAADASVLRDFVLDFRAGAVACFLVVVDVDPESSADTSGFAFADPRRAGVIGHFLALFDSAPTGPGRTLVRFPECTTFPPRNSSPSDYCASGRATVNDPKA